MVKKNYKFQFSLDLENDDERMVSHFLDLVSKKAVKKVFFEKLLSVAQETKFSDSITSGSEYSSASQS